MKVVTGFHKNSEHLYFVFREHWQLMASCQIRLDQVAFHHSVRLETEYNGWIGNFTEEVSHIINNPSKLPNIFRLSSEETEMVSASIWAKRLELEENSYKL